MAVGERLSCRIVAGVLEDQGIEAQFVNLEAAIEAAFNPAALDQNFYDYLSCVFASALSDCGHRVPVVTGKRNTGVSSQRGIYYAICPPKYKLLLPRFICAH